MTRYLSPLFLACIIPSITDARAWTSNDGRTLQADYISSTQSEVKVRRASDGRIFNIAAHTLSQADQEWLKTRSQTSTPAPSSEIPSLPKEVAKLVQQKGSLIFEDDFNREDSDEVDDLGKNWFTNSKSRAGGDKQNDLIDGVLVMTISPKADHSISTRHTFDAPFKDVIVSLKMKIPKDGSLKLAYNDRKDKSVHAGHINGVTIRPANIKIDDERSGRFNLKYRDDKTTPEAKAAFKASAKQFPFKLEVDVWHDVVTHHNDDTLTIYIDGIEAASFSSPGFAHPTKRDLAFAVPKKAYVDDLKVWALND